MSSGVTGAGGRAVDHACEMDQKPPPTSSSRGKALEPYLPVSKGARAPGRQKDMCCWIRIGKADGGHFVQDSLFLLPLRIYTPFPAHGQPARYNAQPRTMRSRFLAAVDMMNPPQPTYYILLPLRDHLPTITTCLRGVIIVIKH